MAGRAAGCSVIYPNAPQAWRRTEEVDWALNQQRTVLGLTPREKAKYGATLLIYLAFIH